MSQNRELEFIEPEPGKWFYVLEDSFAPKDAWDWHEFARCYGPFNSLEAAEEHQYDLSRISTPGANITPNNEFYPGATISRLIEEATLERAA